MKKYVILLVFAIATLLTTTSCSNRLYESELMSGDVIPSSIKLVNTSGIPEKIDSVKSKYKVVFYLDDKNSDCMDRLNCISKVISLINLEGVSYHILWEDTIPTRELKMAGIDEKINYSLGGKVSLSESKPNAFLMDEKNKIVMVAGYSYISLISKIIELNEKKDLTTRAGEMILENATGSDTFLQEHKGKTLLMFISSSCKRCKEGEEIIRGNMDLMGKKMNVIAVRPDFDTRQDFDKYLEIDPQQIYFNTYCHAMGVEAAKRKYPMFFVIDGDLSVEKMFTNSSEAVNYVLSQK